MNIIDVQMNKEALVRELAPQIGSIINKMPPRWRENHSVQVSAWRRLIAGGSPRRATRQFVSTVQTSGAWYMFLDCACPPRIAGYYRESSDGYSSDY